MSRVDRNIGSGLYRSRNGAILGVCKGIAAYFDLSVFWVRFFAFLLLIFTGIWPVMIFYFIAALIMKPAPVIPLGSEEEYEFYDSYLHSRKGATQRLMRRYRDLEHRIRRMEDTVTGTEFNWGNKL